MIEYTLGGPCCGDHLGREDSGSRDLRKIELASRWFLEYTTTNPLG
jgi:hypothetical protein